MRSNAQREPAETEPRERERTDEPSSRGKPHEEDIWALANLSRQQEEEKLSRIPSHEQLLALLKDDPESVPLDCLGVRLTSLMQPITDPDTPEMLLPVDPDPEQPRRGGRLCEIIVRDVHTGDKLHTYAWGDLTQYAHEIETKVLYLRPLHEDRLPFLLVVVAGYLVGNLRGPELDDLLREVVWTYADGQAPFKDHPKHKKARRKMTSWLKNNMERLLNESYKRLKEQPPSNLPPWITLKIVNSPPR